MMRPLLLLLALAAAPSAPALAQHSPIPRSVVVDTGQDERVGEARGQDAEYEGNLPSYRDEEDGTILDLRTGLVWQKSPDFVRRTLAEAEAYADRLLLGRASDWRLPTIKELFSIADFRGDLRKRRPYLDPGVFDFVYPDTSAGWRELDGQYWSRDRYVGTTMRGDSSAFGFNFADGRIKAYPLAGGGASRQYVRCVRGAAYGLNDFVDNRDGTVTDRSTGLIWTKADSGRRMDWYRALEYAEGLDLAGHDDWRLPNVKELQTLVDYARAPDARDARVRGPAIDPMFDLSETESWFWTGTTHLENGFAYYVSFGRALSADSWRGIPMNAHGAGAVRSDPKSGDPGDYRSGLGPQKDEIRIENYVRCVRGGTAIPRQAKAVREAGGSGRPGGFVARLDRDGDGKVSRDEFDGPLDHFGVLDRDGDGLLSEAEAPGPPPGSGRGR